MAKEDFSNSIEIKIVYDRALEKITGTREEPAIINEGMTFVMMLHFIFSSYPQIPKEYPAGRIGLLVNGIPVTNEHHVLHNGDTISLSAIDNMTNLS